jgi:hypothetical protein
MRPRALEYTTCEARTYEHIARRSAEVLSPEPALCMEQFDTPLRDAGVKRNLGALCSE